MQATTVSDNIYGINGLSQLDEEAASPDEELDEELLDEESYGLSSEEDEELLPLLGPIGLSANLGAQAARLTPLHGLRRARVTVPGSQATVGIPTQRGVIQAQLSQRFVSPEQLNEAIRKVEDTSARNFSTLRSDVRRVDRAALERDRKAQQLQSRRLAEQSRAIKRQAAKQQQSEARLKKEVADMRQTNLMMMLLNKAPDIQRLELSTAVGTTKTLDVARTDYKETNSLLPILLLSGGLGGGGGDGNNMLLLALALGGGL